MKAAARNVEGLGRIKKRSTIGKAEFTRRARNIRFRGTNRNQCAASADHVDCERSVFNFPDRQGGMTIQRIHEDRPLRHGQGTHVEFGSAAVFFAEVDAAGPRELVNHHLRVVDDGELAFIRQKTDVGNTVFPLQRQIP